MKSAFGYRNVMETPKITKVVVNVGFGRNAKEKAHVEAVEAHLVRITGQKPVLTKAKKSISAFKIREGMIIGATATLRGQRMYDFLEKVITLALPRIRDFRGISENIIDQKGNLTLGFKEYLSFPEIRTDEVDNMHGLEISVATTAKTKKEGLELFRLLGFPFKKDEK